MNKFGIRFSFSTFGESHGAGIGCLIDGVPAGLAIDEAFIQSELDRRKPGQNEFATARKEDDKVEILSGTFEGKSTGTPIAMIIYNTNQKSKDYTNIKDIFRPGHADFTYWHKYGIRDYRGGGRSSARETAARVAAGAVAKMMIKEVGSGIIEIAGIRSQNLDFDYVASSQIYTLDKNAEDAQKAAILEAKTRHDSVGGAALIRIKNAPIGLGEPLYYKLDAVLADAMMGINAVKAVEIGDGMHSAQTTGATNNDPIRAGHFASNHAGGILGGISNGEDINVSVYFKPTPSIFIEQETIDTHNTEQHFSLKGRHDPCVAIRGSVVAESMAAIVIADMLLLNMGRKMDGVLNYYK